MTASGTKHDSGTLKSRMYPIQKYLYSSVHSLYTENKKHICSASDYPKQRSLTQLNVGLILTQFGSNELNPIVRRPALYTLRKGKNSFSPSV